MEVRTGYRVPRVQEILFKGGENLPEKQVNEVTLTEQAKEFADIEDQIAELIKKSSHGQIVPGVYIDKQAIRLDKSNRAHRINGGVTFQQGSIPSSEIQTIRFIDYGTSEPMHFSEDWFVDSSYALHLEAHTDSRSQKAVEDYLKGHPVHKDVMPYTMYYLDHEGRFFKTVTVPDSYNDGRPTSKVIYRDPDIETKLLLAKPTGGDVELISFALNQIRDLLTKRTE